MLRHLTTSFVIMGGGRLMRDVGATDQGLAIPPCTLPVTALHPDQNGKSALAEHRLACNDDLSTGWSGCNAQVLGGGHSRGAKTGMCRNRPQSRAS